MALPLTRLDEAQEEMEEFIQSRLGELRSQQETKNLVGELSARVMDHQGRIRQLLHSEPLRHPEVIPLILVGLAVESPLRAISSLACWKDYWGVWASLHPGRIILPRHPARVPDVPGPQLCVRQSHRLSRQR